jgi:glyoxylase-like metal-dependent hydrolase (beta-lactamase superfamily II)
VAWLPNQRVLFGGCLVKSITTDDLGYVADAVLRDWPATLRRLRARYPAPAITVPGHGTLRGDPIAATQALLAKA